MQVVRRQHYFTTMEVFANYKQDKKPLKTLKKKTAKLIYEFAAMASIEEAERLSANYLLAVESITDRAELDRVTTKYRAQAMQMANI